MNVQHKLDLSSSSRARVRALLTRLASDRRGAAFTEYLIIVGIVALLGISIFNGFRGQIGNAVTGQGRAVQTLGTMPGR